MATLPFLESLRGRLLAHGLPRDYVERTVDELADHFQDLLTFSSQSPDQLARCLDRFGTIDQLTQRLVSEYRQQTFVGRHPRIIFGLLPIPLNLLIAAIFYISCVALVPHFFRWIVRQGWLAMHTPESQLVANLCAGAINTVGEVVVPLGCAYLLYRLAHRGGWMRGWIWLAAGLVALFSLASTITLKIESVVHSELGKQMQVSLQMQSPQSLADLAIQLLQALLPLAVIVACTGLWNWPSNLLRPVESEPE